MAQVQPVLPHVSITMPVPEAEAIAIALDMLGVIVGDDMPEAVTTFGAQLLSAVEQLQNALATDDAHDEDEGVAA